MTGRRSRLHSTGSAAVMVMLLLSAVSQATLAAGPSHTTPIQHVFIIVQENHSFDNYFGTYPTANETVVDNITSKLTQVNGIPRGVCLPYGTGCVSPHLTTTATPENPTEGQRAYENDYAPGVGFPMSSGPQSMVYFDYHTIPAYWDYAEEYGLADNYYAAVLGMTTPNRLILLTGDALVSANYGPPPYISFNHTIFNQLAQAGVSWAYYDFIGPTTAPETIYPLNYISGMAAYRSNIMDVSSLYSSLATNSGLPAVSFVNFLGREGVDEHPPNSPAAGELQTVSLVNAVMGSKYWNSSVIFLAYDEGGGYYDHVTPPSNFAVDHNFTVPLRGLGQRVPLLVISPFSKTNYVSHLQLSHLSLLHFIEFNWNLQAINGRVADANLPNDFFNFSQPPRPPIVLGSGMYSVIRYPIQLQASSQTAVGLGTSLPYWQPLLLIAISIVTAAGAGIYLSRARKRPRTGQAVHRRNVPSVPALEQQA